MTNCSLKQESIATFVTSFKYLFAGLILLIGLAVPLPGAAAATDHPPVPPLVPTLAAAATQDAVLTALLDIPYRQDGGIDEAGNFTLLADPAKRLTTPGLNCSGLVLEASRFLLQKNITISDAVRDRQNDSGPGAPLGHDWDFGWDLLLNISEGFPRTLLLPGNASADPSTYGGISARGYDLHDPATWNELPDRIRPGYLYLASFSRETTQKGYKLLHYHVALLHRNDKSELIITQTTGASRRATARNLSTRNGLDLLLTSFANTGTVRKMIAVIEVPLPGMKQ